MIRPRPVPSGLARRLVFSVLLWGAATVGLYAAARQPRETFAAISDAPLAVSARPETQVERGEEILTVSCTTCHDLRPIEVQAMDADGWEKTVKAEVAKGAKIGPEDTPVLIDYLVKLHGPVPDGPGRSILLNTCTLCHDLQRVRRRQATAEGWAETLDTMLNEGAPLSEQDFPVLLRYLERNFGPR